MSGPRGIREQAKSLLAMELVEISMMSFAIKGKGRRPTLLRKNALLLRTIWNEDHGLRDVRRSFR